MSRPGTSASSGDQQAKRGEVSMAASPSAGRRSCDSRAGPSAGPSPRRAATHRRCRRPRRRPDTSTCGISLDRGSALSAANIVHLVPRATRTGRLSTRPHRGAPPASIGQAEPDQRLGFTFVPERIFDRHRHHQNAFGHFPREVREARAQRHRAGSRLSVKVALGGDPDVPPTGRAARVRPTCRNRAAPRAEAGSIPKMPSLPHKAVLTECGLIHRSEPGPFARSTVTD